MAVLILGVAVFIGAHLVPSVPSLRNGLSWPIGRAQSDACVADVLEFTGGLDTESCGLPSPGSP